MAGLAEDEQREDTGSAEDEAAENGRRRQPRDWMQIMHPEGTRGSWRDLPLLLADSLRLVWAAGRPEFLRSLGLQLVCAVGLAAQLFLAKSAFGAVLQAGGAGEFANALPELAALLAISVAIQFAQALQAEQTRILGELVGRRALDRVLDVSTRVDLLAFDSPDFYDRLLRAQAQGQFRSLQTAQGLLGMAGSAVASIGILGALTALQPALLPFVVAGFVPLWIVSARNSRDLYRFTWGMTPNDRQRQYFQNLLVERDPAKEVRAFQLAPFFRGRWDRLYDLRIGEVRKLARRRTIRALLGSLASSGLTIAAVAMLAWLYVSGRMSLAATGAAILGLYQLGGQLRGLHAGAASLYEATLFIRDYSSFLALGDVEQPRGGQRAGTFRTLSAQNVSFTYPDSSRRALEDVSLEIRPGEVIALVGENGSGKTTLAKLIAGLYRPERGRILWNWTDVTEVDPEDLRREIALIFQDFERYLLPARENIGLGRYERMDDLEGITAASERAGADDFLRRLPQGYETMLGREFMGGYDLSIGQWQKLALARAFFRDASLVILDEPTAALDARAESRLFASMRDLLDGRSAVLISHRFSSVRTADRIYVLHRGRLVEHGSHDELMEAGGQYSELFTLQAAAYLDGPTASTRTSRGAAGSA